jgi:hypothetical protein
MAVLVIANIPGGSAEQDKAMLEALNVDADPPQGLKVRLAGPTDTGWRIVGLWDSREAFDVFRNDRLMPVMQQTGGQQPEIDYWPIESVIIR